MFKTIGLVGRVGKAEVAETVAEVEAFLCQRNVSLIIETHTASMLDGCEHQIREREDMGGCDLIVVVGGDGSLLGVARDLAHTNTPVVGVNRGGLGFLAGIPPDQLELLGDVLAGRYQLEEHFLLQLSLYRGGKLKGESTALNDIVVHSGSLARMIEFNLTVNGDFVYTQRSDGLIVASPTGSTAYSLSAGGPIMHPSLDAIVIVPMFPHTLTSRPLVVRGDSRLEIVITSEPSSSPMVSCDSQVDMSIAEGDVIRIEKAASPLRLVNPEQHSFFESCRSKLDWASRLGSAQAGGEIGGESGG